MGGAMKLNACVVFLAVLLVFSVAQPVVAHNFGLPRPQSVLAAVLILPIMMSLSLVGGGSTVLNRLRGKKSRLRRIIGPLGAILAVSWWVPLPGGAFLLVFIFGIIALKRSLQMMWWGWHVRSSHQRPEHLAQANPSRLIPAGALLVPITLFLMGMSAFSLDCDDDSITSSFIEVFLGCSAPSGEAVMPLDRVLVAMPASTEEGHLTVANLNTLHGFACDPLFPGEGGQCRLIDRIDLLIQHLAAICPDIVTLQEAITSRFLGLDALKVVGPLESTAHLIEERLPALAEACGFRYEVVFLPRYPRIDDELILTRYPPRRITFIPLYSPLRPFFTRHLLHAQIDHPIGPIDVFTTHLASGGDGGEEPCGSDPMLLPRLRPPPCPEECEASQTVRECQARQVALRVQAMHHGSTPAVIAGDFNFESDAPAYQELLGHGWIDSYLAAGNPECDSQTEIGCTSGRTDYALDDLESPEDNVDVRVDYTFVVPPKRKLICSIDPAGTRLFADDPAVACGPVPNPICWPSDHKGTELELNCKKGDPPVEQPRKFEST